VPNHDRLAGAGRSSFKRAVRGGIIDHDDVVDELGQTLYDPADVGLFVVGRNDDRNAFSPIDRLLLPAVALSEIVAFRGSSISIAVRLDAKGEVFVAQIPEGHSDPGGDELSNLGWHVQ